MVTAKDPMRIAGFGEGNVEKVNDLQMQHQDTPGQHRDASGHRKDIPDGYTDLAETHRWDLRIVISPTDVSLSIMDFYDNIKVSWWEAVTTGYLDPNAYNRHNRHNRDRQAEKEMGSTTR